MDNAVGLQALYEATRLVGGIANLSRILDVKPAHLVAYGIGMVAVSEGLFLKLADVISEHKKLPT
jgi:hypothetical protein